jgi:hypothetical protein
MIYLETTHKIDLQNFKNEKETIYCVSYFLLGITEKITLIGLDSGYKFIEALNEYSKDYEITMLDFNGSRFDKYVLMAYLVKANKFIESKYVRGCIV